MSATFIFAIDKTTRELHHIDKVDKQNHPDFICAGCFQEMIVVKGDERAYHFRHAIKSDCAGARNTALHSYAVQLLMKNSRVTISENLSINYVNARKEVGFFNTRSDVAVEYENQNIHFEIVVTHDLHDDKIAVYKAHRLKCIKIDLSDAYWLTSTEEEIRGAVLYDYNCKEIIFWKEEVERIGYSWLVGINKLVGIVLAFVLFFLFVNLIGRRRQ